MASPKKKKNKFVSILIAQLLIVSLLTVAACGPEFAVDLKAEVLNTVAQIAGGSDVVSGGSLDVSDNVESPKKDKEMRAVWISYIEFSEQLAKLGDDGFTEEEFETFIDDMFDHCVEWNMNTVIVHVHPYGDAFYPSKYFPWSKYISGKQGKDPGFDPLKYMVKAAHDRDLRFEAWLNPYRVAANTTKASSLSSDNPARKWMNSSKASSRRNVLSFGGNLYYNPSKKAVRTLLTNCVKEIVDNYDVDAIHFDDYFYPSLGSNAKPKAGVSSAKYKNYFDYPEYADYVDNCEQSDKEPLSLVKWRRGNVNKLVKSVYTTVKESNSKVEFGISPAGNIDNLLSKQSYYVNINKWLSSSGYVDYICPQVYWTFDNGNESFDTVVQRWLDIHENKEIDLYIGIAVYKAAAGKNSIWDWKQWNGKKTILKKQIQYCRDIEEIDGFSFFSYESFIKKANKKEIKNLLKELSAK